MGLLSRAEKESEASVLDAMGRALNERLKKLPHKKTTPYTALSLLRAYGAFQTGVCLALKDGVYTSYASVGMGIGGISIPQKEIQPQENGANKYFKLDSRRIPEIKSGEEKLDYWVFPLDCPADTAPRETIMIFGALKSSFLPESVSAILEGVHEKMLPGQDAKITKAAPETAEEPLAPETKTTEPDMGAIEEKIAEFSRMNPDFNCVVLEIPGSASRKDKADFDKKVSGMLNTLGIVISLPSGSPLILLPKTADRELILHRLSKTLNTRPLLSFDAQSPENVMSRIRSLL